MCMKLMAQQEMTGTSCPSAINVADKMGSFKDIAIDEEK